MTPARSEPTKRSRTSRQTAESKGCLSGFLLPPLAALCASALLVIFVAAFTNAPAKPVAVPVPAAQAQAPKASPDTVINGNGIISPLFTPEIQYWASHLKRWAAEHGLDVNLAATVMQIESCGNPDARSSAGAMSLFQVMPFHFLKGENGYDPETNARRGMDYLRRSLQQAKGDARLALAGYNGGIGVISRAEANWPSETKRYVYWGAMYFDAAQNASTSARLQEWQRATGNSLCIKAARRLGIGP